MVPRATVIAVLIGVEAALLYGMAVAVGGGGAHPGGWAAHRSAASASVPSSFPAGPHPAVVVEVGMADVSIDTHPAARIDVAVSDGFRHVGSSVPITARAGGDGVRVSADESDFWSFLGDSRTVHIVVPPATNVTIRSAGNVTATGLRGDATIVSGAHFHSADGIRVRDFQGTLAATSDGGRIEVSDAVCPQLRVSAANGRVTLMRVRAAKIDASSSNGRVDGFGLQLHDGTVSSSNGRVSLRFAAGSDTTIAAGATNGHIDVSGLAVTPGTVVRASDADSDDDDSPSSETVRVGSGSGRLDVHAGNGSISLSQEG